MKDALHSCTRVLIDTWLKDGKTLPPSLKHHVERLSSEHESGIPLKQLESPMMKQFCKAKSEMPDALLFFRMGDFFELFGVDAIISSEICNIALTSRDKSSENPILMSGVPASSYKSAVRKCIDAGFKVAICDQIEDPKQTKNIVRREIIRIATPAVPGDIYDDDETDGQSCYLSCVLKEKNLYTLGYVDVSTGHFSLTSYLSESFLKQELFTLKPREILTSANLIDEIYQLTRSDLSLASAYIPTITAIPAWVCRSERECQELILDFFPLAKINAFALPTLPSGLEVVAGILNYLKQTQKNILKNIQDIQIYSLQEFMLIDESTRKHLDIFQTATGEKKGSLFAFLNHCMTAMGSRLLARRLNYPFRDKETIVNSHSQINYLQKNNDLVAHLTRELKNVPDLEKILSRFAQSRLPEFQNFLSLVRGIIAAKNIVEQIAHFDILHFPLLEEMRLSLMQLQSLTELLELAINQEAAIQVGKVSLPFRSGFSAEWDEIVNLDSNFQQELEKLEMLEKEKTQISGLRIGYTRVFGYYFEVTKSKVAQVPKYFIRKQTMTTGERFITAELKELEEKALNAVEKKEKIEDEIFQNIKGNILSFSQQLGKLASILAEIDVTLTFATLSETYGWCQPEVVNEPVTALVNSIHPILKQRASFHERYEPNDVYLGKVSTLSEDWNDVLTHSHEATRKDNIVHLITGPNMAGKSTIMRQVALSHLLCQIGCFVPAEKACLGVCDRIFTRIGSSDNALKSQSTFMVEMLEVSQMIQLATSQSLLLVDEIGRGTSTFDGVSLAWAILEHLHEEVGARTLFSTHYHELQAVLHHCLFVIPMQMEVLERNKDDENGQLKREIIFTRKYKFGSAGRSYGLHVAEMAGLPPSLLKRADHILSQLNLSNLRLENALDWMSKISPPSPNPTRKKRVKENLQGPTLF